MVLVATIKLMVLYHTPLLTAECGRGTATWNLQNKYFLNSTPVIRMFQRLMHNKPTMGIQNVHGEANQRGSQTQSE